MSFQLHAVTQTRRIADDVVTTRYTYIDDATGKTMTLLEPLYSTDNVDSVMSAEPVQHHEERNGVMKIVTTWTQRHDATMA